jgi:hypothetical protein
VLVGGFGGGARKVALKPFAFGLFGIAVTQEASASAHSCPLPGGLESVSTSVQSIAARMASVSGDLLEAQHPLGMPPERQAPLGTVFAFKPPVRERRPARPGTGRPLRSWLSTSLDA